jgi:hypothetical protein
MQSLRAFYRPLPLLGLFKQLNAETDDGDSRAFQYENAKKM